MLKRLSCLISRSSRRAVGTTCAALTLLAHACSIYDSSLLSLEPPVAGSAGSTSGVAGMSDAGGGNGGSAGSTAGSTNGGGLGATSATGGEETGGAGGADEPVNGGETGAGGEGGAPAEPDQCPTDPNKLAPGMCGCGVPDVSTPALADCQTLEKKLLHRYDFEGTGTVVTDRIGVAHGALKGATLSKLEGKGVVLLGGGSAGPYVDLPNPLLSPLTNATLEAWVTWGGGSPWQRIFDFGDSTHASPENNPLMGDTYLMLTPKSAAGVATLGFSLQGNANGQEQDTSSTAALPTTLAHVAVVANDAGNELVLYVNGTKVASSTWTGTLSAINDVNCWLGRSQYDADPELNGVLHEFRIYGSALVDAEIASSFAAGPDPIFLTD